MRYEPDNYPETFKREFMGLALGYIGAALVVLVSIGVLTTAVAVTSGLSGEYILAVFGMTSTLAFGVSGAFYKFKIQHYQSETDEPSTDVTLEKLWSLIQPDISEVVASVGYLNAVVGLSYFLSVTVSLIGFPVGAVLIALFYPLLDYEALARYDASPAGFVTGILVSLFSSFGYIRNVSLPDMKLVQLDAVATA